MKDTPCDLPECWRLTRPLPPRIEIPATFLEELTGADRGPITTITTRFAPSPTGELHGGHLLHLVLLVSLVRSLNRQHANAFELKSSIGRIAPIARILLRMEDHDRQRAKPTHIQSIQDLLEHPSISNTLNSFLHPDCVDPTGRPVWSIQSNRSDIYEQTINELKNRGHRIYRCACSRKEIQTRNGPYAERLQSHTLFYDGFCRTRNISDPSSSLRLQRPSGSATGHDLERGEIIQSPLDTEGDLLIQDNRGNYTYAFVAPVDDALSGVNLIVRGDDLLSSTPGQIQLRRMVGDHSSILFFHHPLIAGGQGTRLSKRSGSTTIPSLLNRGWTLEELLGALARALEKDANTSTGSGAGEENRCLPVGFDELTDRLSERFVFL